MQASEKEIASVGVQWDNFEDTFDGEDLGEGYPYHLS